MEWLRANRHILATLILVQVVADAYLFTTVVLTHHTFPNTGLRPYPTYKTFSEGRWLADIIIRLQGGSGVQSFQMTAAVCLQSLNALLFARIVGLVRTRDVVLAGLVLCLYPAFLDYYSFSIDHLTFCIGDTLVLAGASLLRFHPNLRSAAAATVLFSLSLAAYQPKLSLILLMLAILEILRCTDLDPRRPPERVATLVRSMAASLLIVVGTLLLYGLSLKLTLRTGGGMRTHINGLAEILSQARGAYGAIWSVMTSGECLPGAFRMLPAVAVAVGASAVIVAARARGPVAIVGVLVVLLAMPVALRATYLINEFTWRTSGRITFAYGYALLFFLAAGLRWRPVRPAVVAMMGIFAYTYFIGATQESNAAALKTAYETECISRIAAQAERCVGAGGEPRALVVVGMYPKFPRRDYVRHPRVFAAIQRPAFEPFRQEVILNFFLGRKAFRRPTTAERTEAIRSAKDRAAWPSADAVYVVDETVVVLLEPFREGISTTDTSD